MGVVIEICVKYPWGPTRMTVTDIVELLGILSFFLIFNSNQKRTIFGLPAELYLYSYLYLEAWKDAPSLPLPPIRNNTVFRIII
jgi:hypothetical protein